MELTGKQRRHLRALAHHLDPVVHVGAAGVTEAVLHKVGVELERHELIKVKVLDGADVDRDEAAPLLAEGAGAAVVQRLGRVVVLYLAHPEDPQITLP